MPLYRYRALTAEGRPVNGSLSAPERNDAVAQLRTQGVRPIEVVEQSKTGPKVASTSAPRRGRVKQNDIQVFTAQLAALLRAGIVLSQALSILEEQTESAAMSAILHDVREDIHGGASLSDALAKYPRQFPELYCSMIRVGESGGVLEIVLKQLATFMEKEQALRSSIMTALAYPTLVVMVGIGSIGVLVTFVIPRLGAVFADFGSKLPFLTAALIGLSDWVLRWGWLALIVMLGTGYALRRYVDTDAGRENYDRLKENFPLLGSMMVKAQIARFSRTMGTLVKSGIPVLSALNLVVSTTSSSILSKALQEVCEKVKRGEGLSTPLKQTGFFPPMVTNLIAVGEQSGSLDEMLFQVADTFDAEVEQAIKRFITLFEPIVIILMALGVGSVLFAFLLPIMNISEMIQ
ncbi:MAG: type II secretion system F family protein [Candidatus Hinthialibacter antarcticus]|nr:type II secretion system F family protein [Candidatus Hinthialibacter antarcticus]